MNVTGSFWLTGYSMEQLMNGWQRNTIYQPFK